MTGDVSWTVGRIAWAAFLAAGAPLTLIAMAVDDLRAHRWRVRLARWSSGTISRALAAPAFAGVLLLAWLLRVGDRSSLRYWWIVGLLVATAGLGVALAGAWARARLAPPPAEDLEAEACEG